MISSATQKDWDDFWKSEDVSSKILRTYGKKWKTLNH